MGEAKAGQRELRELRLEDVIPTEENRRKIDTSTPSWKEFVASIREQGVRVPVHCRPHPTLEGKFDLRAGERRYRASVEAGLETIPAIVGELSDEAAHDLTIIENFMREDLSPLEEAAGVTDMLAGGRDVRAVAAVLGKGVDWVRLRAKLADLAPVFRKAWRDEASMVSGWSIRHMEKIARFPVDQQRQIFAAVGGDWQVESCTVEQLEAWIENNVLHRLSAMKWKLGDAELVSGAVPCSECKKTTAHHPLLFDDIEDPETSAKKARCLDAPCWAQKAVAHLLARKAALSAKHADLVLYAGEFAHTPAALALRERFGAFVNHYEADRVKKGTAGARPALSISGKSAGTLCWIRFYDTGSDRAAGAKAGNKGATKSLATKRKELESRRFCLVLGELKLAIRNASYDDVKTAAHPQGHGQDEAGRAVVLALAAAIGTGRGPTGSGREQFAEALARGEFACAGELWGRVSRELEVFAAFFGSKTAVSEEMRKDAAFAASIIGFDMDAATARAAEKLREPKSWSKAAKGKTAKRKAAKKKVSPAAAADLPTLPVEAWAYRHDLHDRDRVIYVGQSLGDLSVPPGRYQVCVRDLSESDYERFETVNLPFGESAKVQEALDAYAEMFQLERACCTCGCTETMACPEGCSWIEPGLCSACADKEGPICDATEENEETS